MQSVWQKGNFCKKFPEVTKDLKTDILVIGGGMAGILCAHKLQEAGREVVLVEAERIGSGVTARTTAVLTAQHDFLYQDIAKRFDINTARAYLHANLNAVQSFRQMAKGISCDFEDMPSIQFAAGQRKKLHEEMRFVNTLGFPANYCTQVAIPELSAHGVVYPGMAQFHPLKFIGALSEKLKIYENCRVLDIDGTTVQSGNSGQMIFAIDEIIEYVSRYFTLKTGDLIFTGTPAGVGPVAIDNHLQGYLNGEKVLDFHVR